MPGHAHHALGLLGAAWGGDLRGGAERGPRGWEQEACCDTTVSGWCLAFRQAPGAWAAEDGMAEGTTGVQAPELAPTATL